MPYFETSTGQLVYFAHCPKAGGSSVEDYLLDRYGPLGMLDRGWDSMRHNAGRKYIGPKAAPQHLTWEAAKPHLPRNPDYIFAVVRDPVSRLVSEYNYQAGRSYRIRRAFGRLGFGLWLRSVLAAASQDPWIIGNHIRPQTDFIPETAVWFRLEDGMDKIVIWLDEIDPGTSDATMDIPHSLKSKPRKKRIIPSCVERSLVAKQFAQDYARFSYQLPENPRSSQGVQGLLATYLIAPIVLFLNGIGRL